MADGAWGLSRAPPWEAKAELGKGRTPFSSSPDALPSKCTKDFSSGGEANSGGQRPWTTNISLSTCGLNRGYQVTRRNQYL